MAKDYTKKKDNEMTEKEIDKEVDEAMSKESPTIMIQEGIDEVVEELVESDATDEAVIGELRWIGTNITEPGFAVANDDNIRGGVWR